MKEKILSITEGVFKHNDITMEGFVIKTDKQFIKLGIDNVQDCCEEWGYFMTEDNPHEFVYSDLLDISITDTCLNTEKLVYDLDDDEQEVMFVNLNTTNGTLQFVAYNCHNGYYGHSVIVSSQQLEHEETL